MTNIDLTTTNTDEVATEQLQQAMQTIESYYQSRGIFADRFGFGERPAILVVDFANGWTDDSYAGGSQRLDTPVENTAKLLVAGREHGVPIVYTTSPWRPRTADQMFKTAADVSDGFRPWDEHACQIDDRLKPATEDLVIQKESASAFAGTHLAGYLISLQCDSVLITGCSTSACIRATATDAKSLRLKPVLVGDCCGDRAAAAHVFTLFDIQARFADVVSVDEAIESLVSE
ncbi:MAG: isochorismatase family protein [Planctomycetota bacterium]|nr:isochorismatase family protein [Planctomycetota bacterium]MEC9008718.1 isochorismatase family protein [Planctomycetota bacterium]MEE3283294.1 isochorismatase family protein [Planctomycetota bacterium]